MRIFRSDNPKVSNSYQSVPVDFNFVTENEPVDESRILATQIEGQRTYICLSNLRNIHLGNIVSFIIYMLNN
jgi:hypothetical protein